MGDSTIRRNLLLLATVGFVILPAVNFAGQSSPKDVIEFYLAIPGKFYEPDRKHREELLREQSGRIIAKDVKNGYLAISGDAGDPGIVVAIFKKTDGQYIIGLNVYDEMTEQFYFLRRDDGVWRDISSEIVPEYNKRLKYELPRYGTTVKVTNKAGKKLYDLVWNQDRFVKKP